MDPLFGFHMPNFTFPGIPDDRLFDRIVQQAQAAEKAGFDLVTVMDHFYQIRGIGPETEPMMEAYPTLGALAARTSRVKLGTLVTGVTYRNPAVLAKMVTTLDVISKGRAIFGIGAAWNEDEHKGYGIDFPPVGRRMDRLDEVGETFAFGAEESFGMLLSDELRDKDGVTAALVVGEMIGHFKAQGLGLFEAVDALQARVGAFRNRLVNLEDPKPGGAQRFAEAMARLRSAGLVQFGGEKVIAWEDFQSGRWHGPKDAVEPILDRPDRRDIAQEIPRSNVLKFRLESGAFAAFRPSGTEPKLKIYLQSRTDAALLDRMEAEGRKLLGL